MIPETTTLTCQTTVWPKDELVPGTQSGGLKAALEGEMERETNQEKIIQDIISEREDQDNKWGKQTHPAAKWLAILVEEVGEVAFIVNKTEPSIFNDSALYNELIQVAAVCVVWLECLKRKE